MKKFTQYSKQDIKNIAQTAIKLSKKSEEELFIVIGHGLNDLGLKPSKRNKILYERVDTIGGNIRAIKAFGFVENTKALNSIEAKKRGREFSNKFNEIVKSIICSNKKVNDFINGNGNLKLEDVLSYLIPLIIAALGLTAINPTLLAVIIGAIGILLKIGFAAYCKI